MLSTVGCGIAMGNAEDEVKKYASKITDTVHNDGVAIGIKEFVFNKQKFKKVLNITIVNYIVNNKYFYYFL